MAGKAAPSPSDDNCFSSTHELIIYHTTAAFCFYSAEIGHRTLYSIIQFECGDTLNDLKMSLHNYYHCAQHLSSDSLLCKNDIYIHISILLIIFAPLTLYLQANEKSIVSQH